jgi:hypothetical protein
MSTRVLKLKSIALAAALAAGVSGMACADDSSMNPLTGDSYAYFNGGDLSRNGNPVYDQSPSSWRQSASNELLAERQLQAFSTFGLVSYKPAPVFDMASSTWRPSHPNGLSEGDVQSLSSEALEWHQPNQAATSAFASADDAAVVAKPDAKRPAI